MEISELLQENQELQKANRILQKKLDRSESNRFRVEDNDERKSFFLRKIIHDFEESQKIVQRKSEELEETLVHLQQMQAITESAKQAAEAASLTKSQFLANMSHELRTPLNAIIGYSEMLVEEAIDAGQQHTISDLGKIQSAGKHLLCLIDDVLDLSKIESGKMELYSEAFNVHQLIEQVTDTLAPACQKNNNQLVFSCDPAIECMWSDLTKIRQSLVNLLSNACKFTQNGRIQLTVTRELDRNPDDDTDIIVMICFEVRDTGIGIKPEKMYKLFQPFSQADSSTTRKYGGTGLGLAITREFVTMMGGTISVDSVVDVGTTFIMRLPQAIASITPTASFMTGNLAA
jgi:signal transduction histidine kinase